MKKVRILSIDGGGIKGILPGVVLDRLETKLQQQSGNEDLRISDMFDFFAGTSTGGILAIALLIPAEDGRPKFTAQDALNIYLDRGDEIFDVNLGRRLRTLGGTTDEKYSAQQLEKALKDNFGNVWFSELLKPCIISAYDIQNGSPFFFKQHRSNNNIYNFRISDIARATSAAPTYFEPARITNELGSPYPLIDGGVFVNNPALAAYSEVRTMSFGDIANPGVEQMMIVSLGCGNRPKTYDYEKAKDWGAIGWVKPVIEIMMSGNAQTVDYHLQRMYETIPDEADRDYYRLNPEIKTADPAMDNASPENMQRLKEDALNFISTRKVDKELDLIAKKLLEQEEEAGSVH
jgi:patatin-like phospholipase/acyl hydrolase